MIVAHHPDLLRLFQDVVNPLSRAIQDDVGLGGVLDLFQQRPETKEKVEEGMHEKFATRSRSTTARVITTYLVDLLRISIRMNASIYSSL